MSTQHLLAWLGFVFLSLTLAWNGLVAQGPAGGTKPTPRLHTERNLAAWGVVGDGVADDTDALQKVIDQSWGDLDLPRGTYRLTRSLVIDLDRVGYTSITGQGTAVLVSRPG